MHLSQQGANIGRLRLFAFLQVAIYMFSQHALSVAMGKKQGVEQVNFKVKWSDKYPVSMQCNTFVEQWVGFEPMLTAVHSKWDPDTQQPSCCRRPGEE